MSTRRIAVMLPLELEFSGRLLAGAVQYVREHRGIALIDMPFPVDDPNALRLRAPLAFDAVFLWATREALWVRRLLAAGLPIVSASSDWAEAGITRVSFDSRAAVELAVDHLARLQPAVLVQFEFRITGVPVSEARVALFREAAKRHGIPSLTAQVFRSDGSDDNALARRQPLSGGAERRVKAILRKLPRPAALWCTDDTLGLRLCELAESLGLRVPEDLAVLGFGDFCVAATGRPPLSSLPLPGEIIGYRAFAVLDGILAGKRFPAAVSVCPPPVVERESTHAKPLGDPVRKAQALIEARSCQGITVLQLARAVSLSPQSLHDRFLHTTGRPPGEEIRLARLATAKRHLADPRLTIGRVAHLCGFNQQSKFSNFFRRGTGLSPRAWRQQLEA